MSIPKAFLLAIAAGCAAMLALLWSSSSPPGAAPVAAISGRPLLDRIAVREQVALSEIAELKAQGIRSIIDLRPDGEAADQPSSTAVGEAVRAAGMTFAYVPAPHGDIPETVVTDLGRALASAERPVLLYCRSGKRAARSWALAEASRKGGATAAEIASAVTAAGQSVDDLRVAIDGRIAARSAMTKAE